MKWSSLFALLAMIPAALNASVPKSIAIATASCGGGQRTITIPMRPDTPAQDDDSPCCTKACHSGGSRKRSSCGC